MKQNEQKMPTLRQLIELYGADGYVYADAGSGAGFPENGQFVYCDLEDLPAHIGAIKMLKLSKPHFSEDGTECHYASEWFDRGTDNHPYSCRYYF